MEAIPEEWLMAGSSRCQARPCPPQLEQVVRQADEVPLRGYLAQAAEGEATKSSSLFGRAKDRIDDRLAKFVDGVPLGTTNAPLEHARYRRGIMRLFTFIFLVTAALLWDPVANAACDHPYWTLSKGATQHYKSSNGHESTWKIEKVEGDKATVTIAWTYDKSKPARESQIEVECNGEAISLDFTKLGEGREGTEMKVVKRWRVPAAGIEAESRIHLGYYRDDRDDQPADGEADDL